MKIYLHFYIRSYHGGYYKVASNSSKNLIIYHFKGGKNIRTIGKHVKLSVFAIIKRWKLRETIENAVKSEALYKLTLRNQSMQKNKKKLQDLVQ